MDRILKSKYKILEKIADSRAHVTYSGSLVDGEKPIVIKIFRREFLNSILIKKLKKDIARFAKIKSPFIPKIIDGDYGWQGFYFIREFVDGQTVKEINKPMEIEAVCKSAAQICRALSYLHSKNMVHGSVTAENVFISGGSSVKVADFGIKTAVSGAIEPRAKSLFTDEAIYLAPEVILGEDPSPFSDIYQTGLVMYFMLTGSLPANNGHGLDLALNNLKIEILPPSALNNKIPGYLDEIVMHCLEKDPLLRFENALQMENSIENKALLTKNPEMFEIPDMSCQAPEEAAKKDEKTEPASALSVKKDDKINIFKWVVFAVLAAIAAGIAYSLINLIITGE